MVSFDLNIKQVNIFFNIDFRNIKKNNTLVENT